jgi:N-acetylglutamate synthase-like GNAT family acetyltransferase
MTDSPNIHIRVATMDDRAAMMPAINAAFAIEKFLEGTRTDEARLSEMMESGEFLIAQNASGKIIACAYTESKGERGYLGMLAVDPAEQGKGLGRVMVDAVEDYCRKRGCSGVDLVVISLRSDLPPFYRKLGYVETGTEEFHPSRKLKPGVQCHCIVMSKEF